MRILFIGCGSMGGAIVSGMLRSCNFEKGEIFTILPNGSHNIGKIEKSFGIKVFTQYPKGEKFDAIVFAVKPQTLYEILPYYKTNITDSSTLILSIAAGKKISFFSGFFNEHLIVRLMPNLAATVNKAVTVACSSGALNEAQKALVDKIFTSIGNLYYVNDENLLDVVTAISGSGPAYLFNMAEHLKSSAIQHGLDSELASHLVCETFIGAAKLLENGGKDLEELRQAVSSKGGTTEAGLKVFNSRHKFENLINKAIIAAVDRSRKISDS
jgi:pyrroline-5-carboxylate reductase